MELQDRFISRVLLIDYLASDKRISSSVLQTIQDVIDDVPDVNNLEQVTYCQDCEHAEPRDGYRYWCNPSYKTVYDDDYCSNPWPKERSDDQS